MATTRILRGNAYGDSIMTTRVATIECDNATSSKHPLALIAQEVWSAETTPHWWSVARERGDAERVDSFSESAPHDRAIRGGEHASAPHLMRSAAATALATASAQPKCLRTRHSPISRPAIAAHVTLEHAQEARAVRRGVWIDWS
jgi:hypothetical protein